MVKKLLIGFIFVSMLAACGTAAIDEGNSGGQPNTPDLEPVIDTDVLVLSSEAQVSGDSAEFKIELLNNSDEDLELLVPTGQKYEIVVSNPAGEEVYRYSIDKIFTMGLETIPLAAQDTLSWQENWDLMFNGERVSEGVYNVEVTAMVEKMNGTDIEEIISETQLVVPAAEEPGVEEPSEEPIVDEPAVEEPEANQAFRNVKVVKQGETYVVTGEARVFEAVFQYKVEDGHTYLIEETTVQVPDGAPAWSPFTIEVTIPQEKLPVNGAIHLILYEISANDGSATNILSVKLDQFKKE